jgi:NADPH-dependent ferric siderophore reductase
VANPRDQRELPSDAAVQVVWVQDAAACLAAVRAWDVPEGEGFAWCAGEASAMAEVRRILVVDKGLDKACIRAAAYWKRGAQAHHASLEDAPEASRRAPMPRR